MIHRTRVACRPSRSPMRLGVDRGTHPGQRPCRRTKQAGHTTAFAPDQFFSKIPLATKGPSTHGLLAVFSTLTFNQQHTLPKKVDVAVLTFNLSYACFEGCNTPTDDPKNLEEPSTNDVASASPDSSFFYSCEKATALVHMSFQLRGLQIALGSCEEAAPGHSVLRTERAA